MGPLRCVVCEEPKLYSQPWKPRQGGVLRLRRSSLYGTLNGPPNGDYHASPQIGSARWLRQRSFAPTGIKISPRTRANETARIVAKELGELPVICASGLDLATLNELIELVRRPPSSRWVLLGHNPALESWVRFCYL